MITDQYYMRLALQEARKGIGRTAPNPCVGAVIVKDNRIIAKGYHKKAGTPHAEVNALRKAGGEACDATIYVTLEPCNHTGRTPPCSHAILNSGITRVVVGMEDPNPLVDGSGNSFLRNNGVEVVSGVLSEECRKINRPFIKFITTSRPWVVMKAGVSLDGRINYQKGKSGWITGDESLGKTHLLRDTYDAIMVGIGTVLIDDPSLTTRHPDGAEGRDPVRIILDTQLRISTSAKMLHLGSTSPTWIFCGPEVDSKKEQALSGLGVRIFPVAVDFSGALDLEEVAAVLGKEMISSVLVEGGATVHGAMLKKKLVDHVTLFYAPIFAGDQGVPIIKGVSVEDRDEAIRLKDVHYRRLGDDLMIEGDVVY